MSGFTDFGSHQGGVISGTCVPLALRYYGWYSSNARGMRAKDACSELVESENFANVDIEIPEEKDTLDRKLARSRWAALIKRIYEVDPLLCPHCGQEMRIIAFIEKRDQECRSGLAMKDGEIAERGTHQDLLNMHGTYARLYREIQIAHEM